MTVLLNGTDPCTDKFDLARMGVSGPCLVVAMSCDLPGRPGGARLLLRSLREVTLGRGDQLACSQVAGPRPAAQVSIPDRCISAEHARLYWRDGLWFIRDLGAMNGTYVNGVAVHDKPLHDGDVVILGRTLLVFRDAQLHLDRDPVFITWTDQAASFAPLPATFSAALHLAALHLRSATIARMHVLLAGDPGIDLETLARCFHTLTERTGPFVRLCGSPDDAATHDAIEASHGGTLFCDGITALGSAAQEHLAERLRPRRKGQSAEYEPAYLYLVAATREATPLDQLHPALAARFTASHARIPPLRERPEDLGLAIADALHALGAPAVTIEPLAAWLQFDRDWQGNHDELLGILRYTTSIASDGVIRAESLRPWVPAPYHRPASSLHARFEPPAATPPPSPPSAPTEIPAGRGDTAPVDAAPAYCMLIDNDGPRTITESAYRAIADRRDDYDLFIDMLDTTGHGSCVASLRDDTGQLRDVPLEASGAAALLELMERRIPLEAIELTSIDLLDSERAIERARRKVDVKLDRRQWRSFPTVYGPRAGSKRYVFRPPDDLRFAALRPLD